MKISRGFCAVTALALILLLPFFGSYFLSDDFDLVRRIAVFGPLGIWSTYPTAFFRPLVSLTVYLDFAVGGWNPLPYYLTNFVFHAMNAGVVCLITGALLDLREQPLTPRARLALSAAVGLMFATAPAHAEAVFFVACRTDVQAAFFGLVSSYFFLRLLKSASPWHAVFCLLSFTLGCLSKESVYALPLLFSFGAFLYRRERKGPSPATLAAILSFIVVAAAVLVRREIVTDAMPYGSAPIGPKAFLKAAAKLVLIAVKPALPVEPGVVLGRTSSAMPSVDLILMLILSLGVGLAAWLLARPAAADRAPNAMSKRELSLLAVGLVATGLPVCFLSIPPLSPEDGRLLYLPSAFGLPLVVLVVAAALKGRAFSILLAAWIAVASGFTFLNGFLYRESGEVCRRTIQWLSTHSPPSSQAVLVVPDTKDGRYIWRNGLERAMESLAPAWASVPRAIITYIGPPPSPRSANGTADLSGVRATAVLTFDPSGKPTPLEDASVVTIDYAGNVELLDHVRAALPKAPN